MTHRKTHKPKMCDFFGRFGNCRHGAECRYKHDRYDREVCGACDHEGHADEAFCYVAMAVSTIHPRLAPCVVAKAVPSFPTEQQVQVLPAPAQAPAQTSPLFAISSCMHITFAISSSMQLELDGYLVALDLVPSCAPSCLLQARGGV